MTTARSLNYVFGGFPSRHINYALRIARNYITRPQASWSHQRTPTIVHSRVAPSATYSPWISDERFKALHDKIKDHTMVDIYRCYELWSLAKQITNVDGCILEVGVWRGGTGALLAEAVRNDGTKTVYLADTFRGVVKASEGDTLYKGGEHADASTVVVQALLNMLNLSNAIVLEGVFPEETSESIKEQISLLHCDVDVYSSTKDIIRWTLPRLSRGGIIVFDDYGFWGCEGVTKFANELRADSSLVFIHNLNGHAIFIKK